MKINVIAFLLALAASPALAQNAGVPTQGSTVVETAALAADTDLVQVKVLLGFRTGCSPVRVELEERLEGDTLHLSVREPVLNTILAQLEASLDGETMGKVRKALRGPDLPRFTCQAEMPIFGEAFLPVAGGFQDAVTVTIEADETAFMVPQIEIRQFNLLP